jgi:RNA polymerase sigma-70 factor (ECF subfamily)
MRETLSRSQYDALFRSHRSRIYGLAFNMVRNTSDADDITQETFLRAWTHLEDLDSVQFFGYWAGRIAWNISLNLLRRRRRRPTISLDAPPASLLQTKWLPSEIHDREPGPQEQVLQKMGCEEIHGKLARLPPSYRTTLLLLQDAYSYEEIASEMDCPIGTVRSRIHRARMQMRRISAQGQ